MPACAVTSTKCPLAFAGAAGPAGEVPKSAKPMTAAQARHATNVYKRLLRRQTNIRCMLLFKIARDFELAVGFGFPAALC